MHITIKTYTDTRNMEVPQTESALYKAIGEQLLNLSVPNRLLVSTPVGEAEFDVKQRGTFAKDGTIYPSMYVTEEYNTIQLPQDTYPEAYLTCINPVSNNYKFYHFRPSGSVLNATYGRIGAGRGEAFGKKDLKTPYPIHLYWIRYYENFQKDTRTSLLFILLQLCRKHLLHPPFLISVRKLLNYIKNCIPTLKVWSNSIWSTMTK